MQDMVNGLKITEYAPKTAAMTSFKKLVLIPVLVLLVGQMLTNSIHAAYMPFSIENDLTGAIFTNVKKLTIKGGVITDRTNGEISFTTNGDITSTNTIADNVLVRGDGGAKGIQGSHIVINDSDQVSGVKSLNINGSTGNTVVVDTTSFVVDATNNRVGIGTAAPSTDLDVNGTVRIRGGSPTANYILSAVDNTGLATWTDAADILAAGGVFLDALNDAISDKSSNLFLGNGSGLTNSGEYNTGVGILALNANTSGNGNTAMGYKAINPSTTGDFNTGFGAYTLNGNTTGIGNIAVGYQSGFSVSNGDYNLTLGYKAGDNITTGNRNIILGYDVDAQSATASDQINIGNTIYGNLATDDIAIGNATLDGAFTVNQTDAADIFNLQDSGTNVFTVVDGGNVGIGVAAPSTFKLEIAGNIGPEAHNTRSLGSSAVKWANVYGNNFNGAAANITTYVGTDAHISGTVNGGLFDGDFTNGSILFANAAGVISQNNAQFFWDNTATDLKLGGDTAPNITFSANDGTTVFNEQANSVDFRIEGDTDANLFFVDGSADNIGIGNNNPANFKLQVTGNVGPNTDSTHNLGSNAIRWANTYSDNFNGATAYITDYYGTNATLSGTINGSTLVVDNATVNVDLTVSDDLAVGDDSVFTGDATFSSMTAGSIAFFGTAGLLSQDNANFFYNDTTDALYLGGATAGAADIILANGGAATFNEQSNAVNFRVESDGNTNMLLVDGTNNRVGIGTNAPSTDLDVNGTVRIRGGSPLVNYVLSAVDSTGLATWSDISEILNNGGAFLDSLNDAISDNNSNLFLGNGSGLTNAGEYNTGVGILALNANTAGNGNTAMGYKAINPSTTGDFNTGFGAYTLNGNTTGIGNIAVGYQSGFSVSNGDYNLTLGYKAGDNITTGNRNIILGYDVDAQSATASDQINIGNTIYGNLATDDIAIGNATLDGAFTVNQTDAADIFNLQDSGTNVFTVVDGGNVGIGVAAPSTFKLEIAGNIGPSADSTHDLGTTGVRWRAAYVDDVTVTTTVTATNFNGTTANLSGSAHVAGTVNGGLFDGDFTNGSILFANAAGVISQNNAQFYWDNDATDLKLGGKTAPNITLSADDGATVFNEQANVVDFRIEGDTDANLFFVDGSADNIGIGNNNPANFKLQVTGNVGPNTDSAHNLGSNAIRWANTYSDNFNGATAYITDYYGTNATLSGTINGSTLVVDNATVNVDLTVSDDLAVGDDSVFTGDATFSSMTAGSIPFFGTAGLLSQDNANFFYDNTADKLLLGGATAGAADIILANGGAAIFNEQSNAVNFRVESDSNANMLFVDGTNNRVGVGTATPSVALDVNGDFRVRSGSPLANYVLAAVDTTGLTVWKDVADILNDGGAFLDALNDAISDKSSNLFLGNGSGLANAGEYNTGVGILALNSNTAGNGNTAMGYKSINPSTTGDFNTGFGAYTLNGNTTGIGNIAVGYQSGFSVSNGDYNLTLGYKAGDNITTGNRNIILGYDVDAQSATASDQINIGNTIYGNLATDDIAIGNATLDGAFTVNQTDAADIFNLQDSGTNVFTVVDGGNVGIGVAAPSTFKLEIAGNIGPSADSTHNLGSTAVRWANTYSDNFNGATANITTYIGTDAHISGTVNGGLFDGDFTNGSILFANAAGIISQDNANFYYDDATNQFLLGGTTAAGADVILGADAATTFNEQGNSVDLRIEGDTDANLFFVDGSADNIGIGNNNPANFKLQVTGNVGPNTDSAHNLGSNAIRWANTYSDNFNGATAYITDYYGTNATLSGTINGSTLVVDNATVNVDLTVSDDLAVGDDSVFTGDATFSSMTAGSIPFFGTAGLLSQDNANFFYDNTADKLLLGGATAGAADIILANGGAATFNEQSNDADFRVESDGNANMLFVDASTNRVGIGTSTPSTDLDINGTIRMRGSSPLANYVLAAVDATGLTAWKDVADILNDGGAFLDALNDAISDKSSNLFLGNGSGLTNAGEYNTGVGILAMGSNTAGNGNTAMGYRAGNPNTIGNYNTAVGMQTLNGNDLGAGNIALGYKALYTTNGDYNLGLGYKSGYAITTGDNNITMGYQAGDNLTTGSRNIILGYDIDAQNATANDQINIGNTIYGNLATDDIAIGNATLDGAFTVNQTDAADIFNLQDSGTNVFTVVDGGNVGIGVAAPSTFKLEIAGNIGPSADSTHNLGSTAVRWANTYSDNFNGATANITTYIGTDAHISGTVNGGLFDGDFTNGSILFANAAGVISQNNAQFYWDNDATDLKLGGKTAPNITLSADDGATVFNEQANVVDFRIEGDTDANLFFVDGSADNIGIGNNNPANFKLQVTGNVGPNTDSAHNLGSNAIRWANTYSDNFNGATAYITDYYGTNATLSGTINGSTLVVDNATVNIDLTVSDDLAVGDDSVFTGDATFSSMTAGSIPFFGTAGLLSQDNANFFYDNTADKLLLGGATAGAADIILANGGAATFNEQSNDADFRVESDGNANMLFVDASTNRVGIGTSTPSTDLDINGTIRMRGSSPLANYVLAAVDATGLTAWKDVADILNDGGAFLDALNDAISDKSSNLFLGNGSGLANAGEYNTGVGILALNSNTAGNGNTAMGYKSINPSTTGDFNTGFGAYTLNGNTTGIGNIAVGYQSGFSVSNGDYNLTLGYKAGDNITTGNRNIILGYDVDAQSATASDQINIGNTIYGNLATDDIAIGNATLDGAFTVNQTDAADIFNLQDSGTNVFTVVDGGNVGIGVAAPSTFKLEIAGNIGPSADSTHNLGSNAVRWANTYSDNFNGATANITTYIGTDAHISGTVNGGLFDGDFTNGSILFANVNGVISQNNAQFYWDNDATDLLLGGKTAPNITFSANDGATVFNEQANAVDFRIEGDTDANLFFVDGSADNIGIGNNNPANFKLQVTGNIGPNTDSAHDLGSSAIRWANTYSDNFNGATANINAIASGTIINSGAATFSSMTAGSIPFFGTAGLLSQDNANFFYNDTTDALYLGGATAGAADIILSNGGAAVFNEQSNDSDFRVESDGNANMLFVDASTNRVGIGTNTPSTDLDVNGIIRMRGSSPLANYVLAAVDATGLTAWKDVADILNDGGAFLDALNDAISDKSSNLFLGNGSGLANAGEYNTGVGILALNSNTSGNGNTAMGYKSINPSTTGDFNTGFGAYTLNGNTTGIGNIAVGYQSGFSVSNGDYNLTLGYKAGDNITTGNRNIILGYDVDAQSATASDQINIGNTIYGNLATDDIAIGNATLDGAFTVNQTDAADIFNLQDSGTTVFTVVDGGNVGIGVAAPSTFKLEIAGNIGPDANNTRSLGSSAVKWANVYGNNFNGAAANITTINSTTGNFTTVNATTFNGATFDGSFTNGSILFSNASGVISQSNSNLFWDRTNNRLGLRMVAPGTTLGINGTLAYNPSASTNITAGGGITVTKAIMRLQGSGGAVDITVDPQIADGADGQIVILKGMSNTNTITLDDGTGLSLTNSTSFTLGLKDTISFMYDAADDVWIELSRSNR